MKNSAIENISLSRFNDGVITDTDDQVAVEEPLEIIVAYSTLTGHMQKNIAVTMRTPGNDEELAAGFLFTEGIIPGMESILEIKHKSSDGNSILVTLHENILPMLQNAQRNFYSTSSCGICGKASIDAIRTQSAYSFQPGTIKIESNILLALPGSLNVQQHVFENTGGIHASALFQLDGTFIMLREDIGRHNALDKLIGATMANKMLPLDRHILLLSGRASFELVQKAVMAGIKIIVAIGAPSSLAIDMAKEAGITLVGFLKKERFNIYSGKERIVL